MTDNVSRVWEDLESEREQAEIDLEDELSVNDWIQRLQGLARQAQGAARAGVAETEYRTWIEAAAVCVGRAEQVERAIFRTQ